jgi:hypothetical protein
MTVHNDAQLIHAKFTQAFARSSEQISSLVWSENSAAATTACLRELSALQSGHQRKKQQTALDAVQAVQHSLHLTLFPIG